MSHTKNNKNKFTDTNREAIIIQHLPLVNAIARRIARHIPETVEREDLTSAGIIGLLDAVDKFDKSRNVQFKTYAVHRIRGAILDSLRQQDWLPRTRRHIATILASAHDTVSQSNGASAPSTQVADYLNMSCSEYYKIRIKCENIICFSLDDFIWDKSHNTMRTWGDIIADKKAVLPSNILENKELKQLIEAEIQNLPIRERTVLNLYYYKKINMKKIGKLLNITESRVSQIHSKALNLLRLRLKPFLNN
ncbi:MAG: FliA/WhiG family RNA polymerase sigma factor [Candidatus Sumerlaeia bacterium]|nr:FliA/WhiG family RNA polymerase sigma factor [Candidatus Sumerlaeia bacterium]